MKILSSNCSCQRKSNGHFNYSQASLKTQKRERLHHARFAGGLVQKKVDFIAPSLSVEAGSRKVSTFSTFSLRNIILLAGAALFGASLFSRPDLKPSFSQTQNGQGSNIGGIFNRSFNLVEPLKMCNLSEAPFIRQERRSIEVSQILQPSKSVVEDLVLAIKEEPPVVSVVKQVQDEEKPLLANVQAEDKKGLKSFEGEKQPASSEKKKIQAPSKESSSSKKNKKVKASSKESVSSKKSKKDSKAIKTSDLSKKQQKKLEKQMKPRKKS